MAKLTETLTEPNVKAASIPQRGIVDRSGEIRASTIANIGGTLLKSATQAREEREVLEKQQVIGDVSQGIIDLEQERNQLLLSEQETTRRIAGIHADGQVTEEERAELESLSGEVARLKEARQSGLLNRTQFSTRLNALHSNALARVENLGIQTNINALFNQGRSRLEAPQNPADIALNNALDERYGVGGWGVKEKGEFVGRQQYTASMIQMGTTTLANKSNEVYTALTNLHENQMGSLIQKVALQGDAGLELHKPQYLLQVESTLTQVTAGLERDIAERRAAGEVIDDEQVQKLRDAIKAKRKFLTQDIFDEGYLKGTSTIDVLKRELELAQLTFQSKFGINPQHQQAAVTGGIAGSANADLLINIAQNDNLLQSMVDGNIIKDVDDARKAVTTQLAAIMSGGVTFDDFNWGNNPARKRFIQQTYLNKMKVTPENNEHIAEVYSAAHVLTQQDNLAEVQGRLELSIKEGVRKLSSPSANPTLVEGIKKTQQNNWRQLREKAARQGFDLTVRFDANNQPLPTLTPHSDPQGLGGLRLGERQQQLTASVQTFFAGMKNFEEGGKFTIKDVVGDFGSNPLASEAEQSLQQEARQVGNDRPAPTRRLRFNPETDDLEEVE